MADPLSVLGGIAAASQLVEQGIKVIKTACALYRQYEDPKSTRQQLVEIERVSVEILH
jgi:hypothetical protein